MLKTLTKWIGGFRNQASGVANPQPWLYDALTGGETQTRTPSAINALGLSTVWSSVNLIAGHMAVMPLEQRRRTDAGSKLITTSPGHHLLNVEANELQTTFTLRQTLQAHAMMTGNGRAWIERDGMGQPIGLLIMPPDSTYTTMLNGEKWHSVYFNQNYLAETAPYGVIGGRGSPGSLPTSGLYNIPDRDVLHIPGLSYSGLIGYSVLWIARTVLDNGIAGDQTQNFTFRNNGRPDVVLKAPRGVLPSYKEADEFLKWFKKGHEGVNNSAKTSLLRDGIDIEAFPVSAQDQQFIESRKFNREDIALIFGTEYLLGQASAVYKDLAERQSAYVTNTLARWMRTWTDECERKLLTPQQFQNQRMFFRFDARDLMKGSPNSLADYTGKLRTQGSLSGNDVRELHGFNRVDDPALELYWNPNITSPDTLEPDDTPADDPAPADDPPADDPQNRASDPLEYNFRTLIEYEARRVVELAGSPKAFAGKLDRFYDRYSAQLTKTCVDLGLPPEAATDHIAESRNQIDDLAAHVQPEVLAESIHGLTKNWPDRSEKFRCLN